MGFRYKWLKPHEVTKIFSHVDTNFLCLIRTLEIGFILPKENQKVKQNIFEIAGIRYIELWKLYIQVFTREIYFYTLRQLL